MLELTSRQLTGLIVIVIISQVGVAEPTSKLEDTTSLYSSHEEIVYEAALRVLETDDGEKALVDALTDPRVIHKSLVLAALGRKPKFPDHTIPAVAEFLNHANWDDRASAVGVLGAMGPSAIRAVPRLKLVLTSDKSAVVRNAAAMAIVRISPTDDEIVAILLTALSDKEVRGSAARAIGVIGPRGANAVPKLTALLVETRNQWSPCKKQLNR